MTRDEIIAEYDNLSGSNYSGKSREEAPHCAMFASIMMDDAGFDMVKYTNANRDLPYAAYAPSTFKFRHEYYGPAGRLGRIGKGYIPKAGDLIFYYDTTDENRYVHTGIVEAYDPNTGMVHTIEANRSSNDEPMRYSMSLESLNDEKGWDATFGINGGTEYNYGTLPQDMFR